MKLTDKIFDQIGYTPKTVVEELQSKFDETAGQLTEIKTKYSDLSDSVKKLASQKSERAFAGAQTTHLTNDWNDIYTTLTSDLRAGLVRMRQRCRQLSMNDSWVKKYLLALAKNVVGPDGFILRNNAFDYKYDEKEKKWTREYDKTANKIIQEAWEEWCLPDYCSITEDISFRELTALILKTIAIDGEILIKPVRTKENKFGYTLQIIEADYLDETYTDVLRNGNIVIMGVELTPARKPVAYWLRNIDSYSALMYGVTMSSKRVRIPVKDENGKIQIKHLFVKEHPSQIRGIPWFAPAMLRIRMFSGYEEAILVDARLSANKTIKYEYKDDAVGDEINLSNVAGSEFKTNSNGTQDPARLIQSSMPGEPLIIPKGMIGEAVDYKSPSGKEGEFQRWALRGIAAALDIAFITLASDYSQVNYTSSRTNLLEERDTWKGLHAWTRDHLLNWNFSEWLKMALLMRAVNLPAGKYDKFNRPWFQGRAWKWVSPKDEAEAVLLMLSNDAYLFEEFLAEQGWSLEEWIDKKKAEKKLFEDEGLIYPGSNYEQVKPIQKEEPSAGNNGNGKMKNLINS